MKPSNWMRWSVWIGIGILLPAMDGAALADSVVGGGAMASAGSAASRLFQWRPFLAPFHSVVLHLPIGFVVIAFALEVYSLRHPREHLERAVSLVLILSVATAAVTIVLGLMRGGSGDYDERALNLHKWSGVAVGAATLLAWALHRETMEQPRRRWPTHCYRVVLVADIAALVIAGHQGGNLTHGSGYLVKHAPQFLKELLEENPDQPVEEPASHHHTLYDGRIKPILDAKCASCHSAEKHKGGYRLDTREAALAGGDSGEPAIKPGVPFESRLVRLILLPRDHDDVMPPAGKDALSDEETLAIIRWIQAGAPFTEAITESAETLRH